MKIGLRKEDALCQSKWCVDIIQISAGLSCIWPPSFVGNTARLYSLVPLSR